MTDNGIDRNTILTKLYRQFPLLTHNALHTIYKVQFEILRLLMTNNILIDIRWLIQEKVRLIGKLPPKFAAYIPGYGKENKCFLS